MEPPNWYAGIPEAGSTTEFYMTQGEYALLTARNLREREEYEQWLRYKNTTKSRKSSRE